MRYFGSLLFTLPLLSLSKALVLRVTDDFNLTMSVVPEAIQGGNLQLEIKGPGPSFFKYMATLTHPNGTEQPLLDYTNFELNNSLSDNPTLPTNRTCMPRTPIGYDIQVNNLTLSDVGTWKVTLDAVFYYGSNGYEYNDPLGGNVCISPPFTAERHSSNPATVSVIPSTSSSSFSVALPTPTPVDFDTDFTGMPFQTGIISTNTDSATVTTVSRNGSARVNTDGQGLFWMGAMALAGVLLSTV